MIPILYPPETTDFSTNGLGGLPDCISATVAEERNGAFELSIEYPLNGLHFDEISVDRIIKAKPNNSDDPQAFRIYAISKPINGKVTISAEHVFYQMLKIPVKPFSANTPDAVLSGVKANALATVPFTFTTNKTGAVKFAITEPRSMKGCLLGQEGSLLDCCGSGDFKFDNFNVFFCTDRGQNRGVALKYGKNIVDLKQEESIEDVITAVVPYWKKDDDVIYSAAVISSENSQYAFSRMECVDFSSQFDEKPTEAQLKSAATEYLKTAQKVPKVNITVDFVNLGDTLDYPELKNLETVDLCDTVTVEFEKLGVNASARVIKTEYDVLAEKYNKIEIGDAKTSFASTLLKAGGGQTVEESNDKLMDIVKKQTALITGASNSYVFIDTDNPGNERILFMDNPDMSKAKNVLQINKNGIGFSQTGVDGDYTQAWTIDGNFSTSFLNSQLLKGVSINITGGKIELNSSSSSDNKIILNHQDHQMFLNPHVTILRSTGKKTGIQPGGIFLSTSENDNLVEIFGSNNTTGGYIAIKDLNFKKRIELNSDGIINLYDANGNLKVAMQGTDGNIWCQDVMINGYSVKDALELN